jgi:myo-inositol-1(or 4)-monophosphatase
MIDINFLKNITLEAGKIALTYFGKVKPQEKIDKSPVTEADLKLDEFITLEIGKKYPDHLILSEEMSRKITYRKGQIVWAVDPLDGTAAFACGLPVWGISLGVLVGDKPLYGAFYIPLINELYYSDGKNSYLWDQKLNISKISIDSNSFLAVPSDAHRNFDLRKFTGKTRSMGSIAAHICYVARGIAIGAVMRGHIWDIAGACAILKTAGGKISYLDGTFIDWEELYSCEKMKKLSLASGEDNFEILFGILKNQISL